MPRRFLNLDAAQSAFLERDLEQKLNRVREVKYLELLARTLIPVNNEASPGVRTLRHEVIDHVGAAKLASGYADDPPRSDVVASEYTSPIRPIIASFGYDLWEVQGAAFAKKPLTEKKAMAARRACERQLDYVASFGDAANGIKGFANHDLVDATNVVDAGGGDTEWDSTTKLATPSLVLNDLNKPFSQVLSDTGDIEHMDTLLLPPSSLDFIASKPFSTTDSRSILAVFKQNRPGVTVAPWSRLETAAAGSAKRMIAYRRDPEVLELHIPLEFTMLPVQERNFEFVVPCHMQTGGVVVHFPKAISYWDLI